MLRFSTSPTGDMRISDLRVAIFNYIASKQREEDFIVRIEDMDKEKNIEGKDQEILDLLALFDIQYTQVTYQSESVRFHSAMALQLLHEKKAFSCFCSPQWLEQKQNEAKVAQKTYKYDDACRNLPAELVIDNTSPFTIRIAKPNENTIIDSFIIMSQDKVPTYNFASAVDDMLNDVSLIIDNESSLNDFSKQSHIRASLNYNKQVEYVLLPNIFDNSSESLSVKSLLEQGYLPEAILNYLILITMNSKEEIFTLKEVLDWFDIETIFESPALFDINSLKDINKEHLKNLDVKELSRYVGFADSEIGELARIYLDEVATTVELRSKIAPIFTKREIPSELSNSVEIMTKTIKAAPYFEEYNDFEKHIMQESGLEKNDFNKSLRLLLTNADSGPEINKIYKYLKNYIGEIIK